MGNVARAAWVANPRMKGMETPNDTLKRPQRKSSPHGAIGRNPQIRISYHYDC
jgi:hypothetical protein